MKHLFIRFLLFYLFFIGISPINAQHRKSANPILSGFHADPEILYSRQTKCYYIYPTSDGFPGWGGSYFKVFSSRNLKEWKEERVILDMKKMSLGQTEMLGPPVLKKRK